MFNLSDQYFNYILLDSPLMGLNVNKTVLSES